MPARRHTADQLSGGLDSLDERLEATADLARHGIGALVVSEDGRRIDGIVSERDILNSIGRGQDPDTERVADHMSETVISAAPGWSLERAATTDSEAACVSNRTSSNAPRPSSTPSSGSFARSGPVITPSRRLTSC